jgi:muramidase (phage lysozyme)
MKLPFIIFGGVVGLGIFLMFTGKLQAAELPNEELTPENGDNFLFGNIDMTMPDDNQNLGYTDVISTNGLHPLLQLIQKRESGGRYNVVFGGATFDDFSTHPFAGWKAGIYAPLGKGQLSQKGIKPAIITVGKNAGDVSTAAGKYQFNVSTWKDIAPKIARWDFTPDTQDALAYQLCVTIGAISSYNAGDYEGAIRKCAARWTSLPNSGTGESTVNMATALRELKAYA